MAASLTNIANEVHELASPQEVRDRIRNHVRDYISSYPSSLVQGTLEDLIRDGDELKLDEKYALLAALHDVACKCGTKLCPMPPRSRGSFGVVLVHDDRLALKLLLGTVKDWLLHDGVGLDLYGDTVDYGQLADRWLDDIAADLGAPVPRQAERPPAGATGRTPNAIDKASPPTGGRAPAHAAGPDGAIKESRIRLKGKLYELTSGLRTLLSYLLAHDGCPEDDVINHCGYSSPSHLHKRLKDLRDSLKRELRKSGWWLHIKTEKKLISCEWREAK
jgi:hypothetical protein